LLKEVLLIKRIENSDTDVSNVTSASSGKRLPGRNSTLRLIDRSIANIELSFEKFVQKFGQDKYREVRESLIQDEALVREPQEALELNHHRRSDVAADCADRSIKRRKQKPLKKYWK
jgi:hypothetical protein